MIGERILQFHDLQKLCDPDGEPRAATVERWAKKIGLRYTYDRNGGMISTLEALNAALGLAASNDDTAPYDPDDVR